ncbi:helix-turn-helix transcriptional regulator [Methylobacterium sp. HMF5984]|uniref:helix-turn-helix transcriptional regulator n=1 Tax=Methylobacterium sp. HMF5984 TaxID=3367370 RepID=UPI00385251EC
MQTDQTGLGANRVLPEHEFARLAGITPTTFRRLRARGETPPSIRLSPRRRGYRMADVMTWLDARTESAA